MLSANAVDTVTGRPHTVGATCCDGGPNRYEPVPPIEPLSSRARRRTCQSFGCMPTALGSTYPSRSWVMPLWIASATESVLFACDRMLLVLMMPVMFSPAPSPCTICVSSRNSRP